MKSRIFIVEVQTPNEVKTRELEEYISTAVAQWAGGYHPDEPLRQLEVIEVKHANQTFLKRLMARLGRLELV